MLPEHFSFIDIETTGASLVHDRITEIALIRVDHGQISMRWHSLVNPGRPIPHTIQKLTGITDTAVADAPCFADLADVLFAKLHGSILVAHNARFDHGFLKKEFALTGKSFDAATLCTVKLSRALYPDHRHHNLDALIERHTLYCTARHRAMGDTEVIWQFFTQLQKNWPLQHLLPAIEQAVTPAEQASNLAENILANIPDGPGVYLFFDRLPATTDKNRFQSPLYIGYSLNLRNQVFNHSHPTRQTGVLQKLAKKIRHVEWVETAGELEARLLAIQLTKKYPPRLHTSGRERTYTPFALRLIPNKRNPPLFSHIPLAGTNPATWQELYGIFSTPAEAAHFLQKMAHTSQLCPCYLSLAHKRSCQCSINTHPSEVTTTPASHLNERNIRLLAALERATAKTRWPWQGPVVFIEKNNHTGQQTCHLFNLWCHLGSGPTPETVYRDFLQATPTFDLEIYRTLTRWLLNPSAEKTVVPMDCGNE